MRLIGGRQRHLPHCLAAANRVALHFFLTIFLAVLVCSGVTAQTPTPEQIRLFKQLPSDQQQAILKSAGGATTSVAPKAEVLPEPRVVKPRAVQTDKTIEAAAAEGTDAVTLAEPKEVKAVKQKLKQFGYDLFAGEPTTFAPATDIPVPAEYVIGPGDTLQVQLFGKENAEYNLVVTREGQLHFPGIGPISVAGLTFENLSQQLHERINRQMIGVKASISMGALRSIRVFVLGDAHRPGSYTVSALSTMTNALFVSGGIRPIGSLRDIQLKRKGKVITRLDLYDLLLRGDTSADVRLLPGDVIFIPPIGRTVGVAGEVRRPAIYELYKEETINEAINMAGGLLPTAYPKGTQLERINEKLERTLLDIDITQRRFAQTQLTNGDVVRIYSVLEKMEDIVKLSGHVERPGGMQWRSGMRVSDLIGSVSDLLPEPDLDYAVIKREVGERRRIEINHVNLGKALAQPGSAEDVKLHARDEIFVFGLSENRAARLVGVVGKLKAQSSYDDPARIVSINGNVRFPGEYPLHRGMSLRDLIKASRSLKLETDFDYALLIREQENGGINAYSVDLRRVLDDRGRNNNILLLPKDKFIVFSLADDRVAQLSSVVASLSEQASHLLPAKIVSVLGNVRFPGRYPLHEGMRLNDLIKAARDLKPETDLDYALLVREEENGHSIQTFSIKLRHIVEQIVSSENLLLKPRDRLIVFSINESRSQSLENVISQLQNQSTLESPAQIVTISGKVRSPGVYPLEKGMTVGDLIQAAGSFQESAFDLSAELTRYSLNTNGEREVAHRKVSLSGIFAGDTSADVDLQPHDSILIKETPLWRERETVTIRGEVRFPGVYTIQRNETLSQLVERAGGLTDSAYADGSVFMRKELQELEQQQIDQLAVRLESDIAAATLANEDVAGEDVQKSLALAQSLAKQLRATRAAGRLVIDLGALLEKRGRGHNILLENGDHLFVPSTPQEVTVIGEVHYPTSHLYETVLRRNDYINRSGGMTYKADDDRIYVVRANGAVLASKGGGWFRRVVSHNGVEPGDTIVVPLDADRIRPLKLFTDISQIVYQLGIAAASWNAVGVF